MMVRFRWVLALGLLVHGVCGGQPISRDDRMAVLKFGIETEVLELVKALRQEKNADFRNELAAGYDHARTDELKEALILFFSDLKDPGLEGQAIREIAEPSKKSNSLLLNALSYLTDLPSQKAQETLVTLVRGDNKILAVASIRALGKLKATDQTASLVELYRDAETDPNFKPDLIWAFGELKAQDTVALLLQEYEENDTQPLLQRSILEALGKIGDTQAWDLVEQALRSTNTDLRAAAVATLGSFPGQGDLVALLTAALRDSQSAVRQAAASAAKTATPVGLQEVLSYRAKKDPDSRVRVASLQALAAYPEGPQVVLELVADIKTDNAVWKEALNLALSKGYLGTADALRKVIDEEAKGKVSNHTGVLASALLPYREAYRGLFGTLLASDKPAVRSAALRAIGVGKFQEYEGLLRSLESKDPDAGVKAQAKAILKDWTPAAPVTPTP